MKVVDSGWRPKLIIEEGDDLADLKEHLNMEFLCVVIETEDGEAVEISAYQNHSVGVTTTYRRQ